MNEKERIEKLKKFIVPSKSNWQEEVRWRKENRDRLRLSAQIAARVLTVIKKRGMSQLQLAETMGVSAQQVSKILKGDANLTLDTIVKLQKCLDISLIKVPALVEPVYEPNTVSSKERTVSFELSFKEQFSSATVGEHIEPYGLPRISVSKVFKVALKKQGPSITTPCMAGENKFEKAA